MAADVLSLLGVQVVVYINLGCHPERQDFMEEQLRAAGDILWERIDGVDARSLGDDDDADADVRHFRSLQPGPSLKAIYARQVSSETGQYDTLRRSENRIAWAINASFVRACRRVQHLDRFPCAVAEDSCALLWPDRGALERLKGMAAGCICPSDAGIVILAGAPEKQYSLQIISGRPLSLCATFSTWFRTI